MSVYKIFPSADASIYSAYPAKNAGLDEILEVSVKNSNNPTNFFVDPVPTTPLLEDDIRRSLILFSNSDIEKISTIVSGSWEAYLKIYLANAENLTEIYNLEVHQVDNTWSMGTGKFSDNPEIRNGVCWYNTGSFITASNNWTNPSYFNTPGGGSWTALSASQSFDYKADKDINMNISNIVNSWYQDINLNHGLLIKHATNIENNISSYIITNFFGLDTHTIYTPCLEIKWDDSVYETGSLIPISNSRSAINVTNNPYQIKYDTGLYQFRISARDQYPVRSFSTSSVYLNNKCLPSSSYWAIQDMKTQDMVIGFDDNYTKISCDSQGSFFNLYINGLQPERYYKIIIKSLLNSKESVTSDNGIVFKVIQ